MKHKTIGIMGGLVSNANLGCVALTYSLINVLEKIKSNLDCEFDYIIFEYEFIEDCYSRLSSKLNIDRSRLHFSKIGFYENENWKLYIKTIGEKAKMVKDIKKCDLVIDITQGDSFTDIYGMGRFNSLTHIKELVVKYNIPLVLAPQTYGPFLDDTAKNKAKTAIEKAVSVMSRDKESADYVKSFSDKDIVVTTDLAFGLPFEKSNKKEKDKIKIGLNPSGLLVNTKTEKTNLATSLATDYDKYIKDLTDEILSRPEYELHIIPHVGDDAIGMFKNVEGVVVHQRFGDPVEAKNVIAQMDVFIGSRMHATIGAFSSGVATIPVAYSRKFSGLYRSLGYDNVVDLTTSGTDDALKYTLELLNNHKQLKTEVQNSLLKVDSVYSIIQTEIESVMKKVWN
ncbi:MAG: polysaccharide pyruvyl transferase family protein [Oscillospiraceae bacterium]|nr:polysaccharide pyruvyl transferase family protein [Oscillospiraceae bacterium]